MGGWSRAARRLAGASAIAPALTVAGIVLPLPDPGVAVASSAEPLPFLLVGERGPSC
jgi:hypothetical protein